MRQVVVVLAVLALATGVAWGQSVQIPVSGTSTNVGTIDPGRQWTDDDGILHIRGMILMQQVTGQDENGVPFTGIGPTSFNINIDLATGDGDFNGRRYDTEYTYGDLHGSFDGTQTATYVGFEGNGHLNYHGGGDFDGWKFRATYITIWGGGPTPFEGVLHNPHGN